MQNVIGQRAAWMRGIVTAIRRKLDDPDARRYPAPRPVPFAWL